MPYFEEVADLLEKYPTLSSTRRRATRCSKKGWVKDGDGIWAKDGTPLEARHRELHRMADIGPVVAEQLTQQGDRRLVRDAARLLRPLPAGRLQRAPSSATAAASARPYYTLRLYQSRTLAVPGAHLVNFSTWKNAEYDEIVDEIAVTSPEDQEALLALFRQTMEIWLPELPDIQIQECYHRIPMNTTYWQGWPTQEIPTSTAPSGT